MKKESASKNIKKSMTFSKLLQEYPESSKILMNKGMHCIGCPMSMQETLEQGALAHGLDPNELVNELNKELKNK